jgi:hypothetical protein
MASITSVAEAFFAACETGKGWEACSAYCTPTATFSAQAEPLLDVKTLAQYTDWMKGLMTVLPDGRYEVKSFATDAARNNTLRKRENPFYVEFFQLRGVSVDLSQRQFLAQSVALAFVRVEVYRLREDERLVEPVELLVNRLHSTLLVGRVAFDRGLALVPDPQH